MNRLDDNMLAAYLEGSLSEEEREWVEKEIEEDDELKDIVDEWISMADDLYAETQQGNFDVKSVQMEACESIGRVMEQVKRETDCNKVSACDGMPRIVKRAALQKRRSWYQVIIVAASLLAFISVTGLLIYRGMGLTSLSGVPRVEKYGSLSDSSEQIHPYMNDRYESHANGGWFDEIETKNN